MTLNEYIISRFLIGSYLEMGAEKLIYSAGKELNLFLKYFSLLDPVFYDAFLVFYKSLRINKKWSFLSLQVQIQGKGDKQ